MDQGIQMLFLSELHVFGERDHEFLRETDTSIVVETKSALPKSALESKVSLSKVSDLPNLTYCLLWGWNMLEPMSKWSNKVLHHPKIWRCCLHKETLLRARKRLKAVQDNNQRCDPKWVDILGGHVQSIYWNYSPQHCWIRQLFS